MAAEKVLEFFKETVLVTHDQLGLILRPVDWTRIDRSQPMKNMSVFTILQVHKFCYLGR